MARVQLGEGRMRARKRKHRLWIGFWIFILLALLGAACTWLARAPFLRIMSVNVVGAQTIPPQSVVQFAQEELAGSYWRFFPKDNILLYPKHALAAGLLEDMPVIANVSVRAQDFHTIVVSIVERQPKALWCGATVATSSPCMFLDEDGAAYAPATVAGSAYEHYFGALTGSSTLKQYLTPEEFRSLSALTDALAQSQKNDSIESVSVDENDDVRANFASGFMLLFALSDAGGDVFQRFTLALQSDVFKAHALSDFEYLDLRFGDSLYYKLKNQ